MAWPLNLRGADIPYTPFALGFALMHADGGAKLSMDTARLPVATRDWLAMPVSVAGREALAPALARLRGKQVRVDPGGTPVWFAQTLRTAEAVVVAGADPCLLPKACKNATEQQGARSAHQRDAVAVCRFLHFLAENAHRGRETEMSAAAMLLAFREQVADFQGESFPAISGAGEHGAIIHYRVTDESNRPIKPNEVYLIEFGCSIPGRDNGHHPHGVDRARRPAAGPARTGDPCAEGPYRDRPLVFPHGTDGRHLDAFARRALWQGGLDYDHGTGHGSGSYLSVHEGPVSLSRLARPIPIEAGMILSNEPGYYLPGSHGIRLENLLLVQDAELASASKPFLRFETLSLAPFDRRLIDPSMLDGWELAWLNTYHALVLDQVGPHLDAAAEGWLANACREISQAEPT